MNANRIRICGRNTITAPTPAITPSVSNERSTDSGSNRSTPRVSAAKPAVIASIGTCAQVKTDWNMTNSTVASRRRPKTGCSATRSNAWPQRRRGVSDNVAICDRRRARRCSRPMSSVAGGTTAGLRPSASASASRSASSPRRLTATVGITGTPNSRASTSGASTSPSRSAKSIMLSATTTGRPSAISCIVKRR